MPNPRHSKRGSIAPIENIKAIGAKRQKDQIFSKNTLSESTRGASAVPRKLESQVLTTQALFSCRNFVTNCKQILILKIIIEVIIEVKMNYIPPALKLSKREEKVMVIT